MIDFFIVSYNRSKNVLTLPTLLKFRVPPDKIHLVIDDKTPDIDDYKALAERHKVHLHIFDFKAEAERYNFNQYVWENTRTPGIARNYVHTIAKEMGIKQFVVMDDDTRRFSYTYFYTKLIRDLDIIKTFTLTVNAVVDFCYRRRIGMFGLLQGGDFIGYGFKTKLWYRKVMNFTFYQHPFLFAGEAGYLDSDTLQFCWVNNIGLFTGSVPGLTLQQMLSAINPGGLTSEYHNAKLLRKAIECVIPFPSAVRAERQRMNGDRLHHKINYRYLAPCLLKMPGRKSNIAWDTYPEDYPVTMERFCRFKRPYKIER